jgi:hypothetical protein
MRNLGALGDAEHAPPAPGDVELGESALYQTIGDEVVVLNLITERYYGLDNVAAAMWHLLLEQRNVATVACILAGEYAADESVIRTDLDRLVIELVDAGLLKAG